MRGWWSIIGWMRCGRICWRWPGTGTGRRGTIGRRQGRRRMCRSAIIFWRRRRGWRAEKEARRRLVGMSGGMEHISDTALLVAAARAAETEREDGLVRDPFAGRLAGERGREIARSGAPSRWQSFGIGLRSRFIDDFVLEEVGEGRVDCVLNMGAGMDARPWRLELPETLRWLEVDFAGVLDYKDRILGDAAPRCRRERMSADVNEATDRQRVFEAACGES